MNRSKKHILILTSEFPPQPGGIGQHALDLATHLSNTHQVQVIADQRSSGGEDEARFDKLQNFKINRVKRNKLIFWTYGKRILKALRIVQEFDLIIATGKFSLWQIHFLKRFTNSKPVLAIIHGSELLLPSKIGRTLTDSALQKADLVVAVSNYTLKLVNHLELPNTAVIPNGIANVQKFDGRGFENSNLSLITVGNVTQRKGQHNVIKAMPEILDLYPKTHYHCVGLPTTVDSNRNLARELGVLEHVTFHGKVNDEQKNQRYSESHIFLMLSERTSTGDVEGFGIAILEANAYGIPAIGSKGCGIEDAIEHGKSGILVNPHDPIEVANAVKQVLDDYDDFQINAHRHVQDFTWNTIIKSYNNIIDQLCA